MTEALQHFPPTPAAARQRLAAVRPGDYARTRNALGGAVTQLSPYITHGLLTLPGVLADVAGRHPLDAQHKFVFELGWRAYFRHVWEHRGNAILRSLHTGPLPDAAYARELPQDVRQARTGLAVIDRAVRTLYATGYLHNHARMWLASYVVHLRKVHWRAGADWMFGHLLDGDLASNHLSWQWVAGTGSSKPYLFNAENVARFAPRDWHVPGSVLDTDHPTLEAIARGSEPVDTIDTVDTVAAAEGIDEPALTTTPPAAASPDAAAVEGQDVWLVHPWALGEPPPGRTCIGWWPVEFHAAWPWSAARWAFVDARMQALCSTVWRAGREDLGRALAGARSVRTRADPHLAGLLPPPVEALAPPALFADVAAPCPSFSAWWNRAMRGVRNVADLPGLMPLEPSA